MAEQAVARQVYGEVLRQQTGQFLGDIGLHPVVGGIGRFGGVNIEPGALAKIPLVGRVGDIGPTRACVRRDQNDPGLGRRAKGAGLGHEGFGVAGQSGQIGQDRPWPRLGRLWKEEAEAHVARGRGRGVLPKAGASAERAMLGNLFQAHQ